MRARTVTTPGGETWRVRRLWSPRLQGERLWSRFRRRARSVRRRGEGATDVAPDGCLDLDDLLAGFAILLVVVLLVVILLPLLLVVVELAVLTLLTVLGLVARVVFRRPWVVEATDSGPFRHTWRIVGWRASREFVDGVAAGLAHGNGLPAGAQRVQRPGDGAAGAAPTDAPT